MSNANFFLSTQINLQHTSNVQNVHLRHIHALTIIQFRFDSCRPPVSACVYCALFNVVPNLSS